MDQQELKVEWIKGCTICDQGMCEAVDSIMAAQGISEREAAKQVAAQGNRTVGHDGFFSPHTIRTKYRRFKGKVGKAKKKKPGASANVDSNESMPQDVNAYVEELVLSCKVLVSNLTIFMPSVSNVRDKDGLKDALLSVVNTSRQVITKL